MRSWSKRSFCSRSTLMRQSGYCSYCTLTVMLLSFLSSSTHRLNSGTFDIRVKHIYQYLHNICLQFIGISYCFSKGFIFFTFILILCLRTLYIAIGGTVKIFSATALDILGMKQLCSIKVLISCLKKNGGVSLISCILQVAFSDGKKANPLPREPRTMPQQ